MKISESLEMYLETILVLSKKGPVRSIDIARAMNFSRPTVSVAIHNL
ncbi:MAG: metal-dependent transcriptional regulator, partial [Spirochaetales bacterium]|nr:metal-dependent transcriptional regulator [Spirochaetales bacterium]